MSEIIPVEVKQYLPFIEELAALEVKNAGLKFDYQDKKGNAEARSHVRFLRTKKADIERARKDAKAYALEYGRKIDGQAKELEARVESMIAIHWAPLEEIEAKESARKQAMELRVDAIQAYGVNRTVEIMNGTVTSKQLLGEANLLSQIEIDDSFGDSKAAAQFAKDNAAAYLSSAIQLAIVEESKRAEAKRQAEELAALKAKQAEMERQAQIDAAARAAEEKAKQEAAAALQKAADEKARLEREAIQREADAKMAAERAELRRLQEAAAAEKARKDAEAKAEADRIAAVKLAEEKAAAEAKRIEDARIAKIDAERKAEAKRKADAEHMAKIKAEILASIHGLTHEQVADALMEGKVAHVRLVV